MRKTLVIIFAVAILGGGIYAKEHGSAGAGSAAANPASSSMGESTGSGSTSSSNTTSGSSSRTYKDGTYKGDAAETPYGTVQIAVMVSGGKISDVQFLQMPDDQPHSREVTAMAKPLLKQSTLAKQSSNIDMVSGATSDYYGYQESLQAALDQAKIS
jgi:uncharacterized protein with FMN-binding domain